MFSKIIFRILNPIRYSLLPFPHNYKYRIDKKVSGYSVSIIRMGNSTYGKTHYFSNLSSCKEFIDYCLFMDKRGSKILRDYKRKMRNLNKGTTSQRQTI